MSEYYDDGVATPTSTLLLAAGHARAPQSLHRHTQRVRAIRSRRVHSLPFQIISRSVLIDGARFMRSKGPDVRAG
eukprot:9481294-Pyramimonas_sp.AAC.2